MLRKYYIFIWSFIAVNINAFANIPDEDFFVLDREMRGVKIITEKSFSKWQTVSYFDNEGFLLRKINYYKNKMRSDYRYEYSMSDTLLEIKEKEYLNINNNPEGYIVYKYYYNLLKKCHRFEVYSSSKGFDEPFVLGDNFIYKDNKLQCYERYTYGMNRTEFVIKCVYVYDDNQRTEQWYEIGEGLELFDGCNSTSIYQNGKLIDFIHECGDEHGAFTGVVHWSREKKNKFHIRYSNFDRRENWTRSYFITEQGRVFRSKRKIEYW